VVVFVDDFLVFSRSKEENALHLGEVLRTLRAHQLKAKFSTFHFWQKEVRFLGHVVSSDSRVVDPAKVVIVQDWKALKSVIEVRSFLCLAGYRRNLIKDFAWILAQLTCLTKKLCS